MNKESLERWMDKSEKATLYTIMFVGVVMLVVAWAHIFYRYVINSSLTWSEEFLKLCLVWFSLLSASIISKRSGHMGIVIFREKMPQKVQYIFLRLVRFFMLTACAVVVVMGIMLVIKARAQLTPALGVSFSVGYAAIPVSFALMFIYELIHIINGNFTDEEKGENLLENSD